MSKKFLCLLIVMTVIILSVCVGCAGNGKITHPGVTTMSTTAKPTTKPTSISTSAEPTAKLDSIPTTKPGVNVALNKYFEVSSETGEGHVQWGWSSKFINDGIKKSLVNENLGWTTNVGVVMTENDWADEWVLIDIGEVLSIDKVIVYPIDVTASFFPIDYHVEVSSDKTNYTTVASVTGDTSTADKNFTPKVISFNAVNAQYVKVVITKPYSVPAGADGYLVQMAEIEIYSAPSGKAGEAQSLPNS